MFDNSISTRLLTPLASARASSLLPLTLTASLVLTACGGGSDNPESDIVVPDPTTQTPVVTQTPGGSGFFNAESKFDYADTLFGSFLGFFRSTTVVASGLDAKRSIAAVATESLPCDSGSLSYTVSTNDSTGELTAASLNFNNCRQGLETSTGSVEISGSFDDSGDNGSATITANNFSVTGGVEPLALNGSLTISAQSNGNTTSGSISGTSITMTAGIETVVFSNYSLTASGNTDTGSGSISAAMQIDSNIAGTLTMAINPPLVVTAQSEYPESGLLVMTHSDGSSLTMNADTGDASTFSYIINDNGTVTSGVANWSETEVSGL